VIDLQGSIKRELKGLVLFLTHWVYTSEASSLRSNPHKVKIQEAVEPGTMDQERKTPFADNGVFCPCPGAHTRADRLLGTKEGFAI
jgi:hypothetical protein